MRRFQKYWLVESIAREMKRVAVTLPIYTGTDSITNREIIRRSTGYHVVSGSAIIFTRDSGHHSSGWWKNPEYERCWHLSLSFLDPLTLEPRDKDIQLTEQWIEVFFHHDKRYVWSEPPYSEQGKILAVWHYRIFCDEAWQPIIPKGEVYSKALTEAGWLSYSDLRSKHAAELALLEAQPGEQ